MRLRESGMPEEAYWESLFDVETVLDRLGVGKSLRNVAELGCGFGTFTLPVARRIGGILTAIDIDPEMVARTTRRSSEEGLSNIACREADVLADGFGVAPHSQDACLLFNILHCEEPVRILTEAARIVRPKGSVLIIHWRFDPSTPRGPSLEIRPRPEQIIEWARETRLLRIMEPILDLPPWHYGVRFVKNPD